MTQGPEGAIPVRERRSLAEEWREFERDLIPRAARREQRVEMRRAFYAGATAMLSLLVGGLDADREPTDLDIQYVSSLAAELKGFSQDLEAGKA